MKILATILATLTQHPRYKVVAGADFQWAKNSWSYNAFRVYELVFWRREGIRKEASVSSDGSVTCYTWEARVAFTEAKIRTYSLRAFVQWATGVRREKITLHESFEWAPSLVYNLFRVYELMFGRRSGVRPEMSSMPDGQGGNIQAFHSWEAVLVHLELSFRALFTFKIRLPYKVWVPILKTPQGMPVFASPYLFAIAWDSSVNAAETNNAGQPWSHTCTGSNMILTVGNVGEASTTDPFTGTTYNGVAMTVGNGIGGGVSSVSRYYKMYYLTHPNAGASHTIQPAVSPSQYNQGASTSFSGASQSAIDNTATAQNTGSNPATSITPVAANCWLVNYLGGDSGSWTSAAGAGTTERTNGSAPFAMGDSNGTVTGGSSHTMNWTVAANNWGSVIMSIAPSDTTIAVDTKASAAGGSGTSSTISYTVTGSHPLLVGHGVAVNGTGFTGFTFNGTAMTSTFGSANQENSDTSNMSQYCIVGVSGTASLIGTFGSSAFGIIIGTSYSGVNQSTTPDSFATFPTTSVYPQTYTTTVVAANSWLFLTEYSAQNAGVPNTNATLRQQGTNITISAFDSNGVFAAGSRSMTLSGTGGTAAYSGIISSFKPFGSVVITANPAFLLKMLQ